MKKIVIFSITLLLILLPAAVYASDFEDYSSSSEALPYLAPDLNSAKAYATAVKIAENTGTRDVTHTIDDLYSLIISMRTYVNNNYQMRTYDDAVLGAIQDLNGYGTAYNTHSMLMDMWMRIGGNSSLGNTYNLTDMIADLSDTINDGLIITDGNETYSVSELLSGIYGVYATPRSIPDLYNRLVSIDEHQVDTYNEIYGISSYIYSIDDAINRLSDIYASQDVAQAKANQQQYENEAVADFTGSGSGAATTGNKNDIKSISSTVKSGLNTGGSASTALGVFTYSGDNWDWFTQTTLDNLYTPPATPDTYVLVANNTYTINATNIYVPTDVSNIPVGTQLRIELEYNDYPNYNSKLYLKQNNSNKTLVCDIYTNEKTYISYVTTEYPIVYYNFYNSDPQRSVNIKVYKYIENTRKSNNNIPDFVSVHDRNYYNYLLETK